MAVLNRPLEQAPAKIGAPLRLRSVLVVAGIAIAVIALIKVMETSQATTTSFAIQGLERQRLALQAQQHELETEVAGLASLSRIENDARQRLGLVPPQARRTLSVDVAAPEGGMPKLPSRFAPRRGVGADAEGSPWWRDLVNLLPFT